MAGIVTGQKTKGNQFALKVGYSDLWRGAVFGAAKTPFKGMLKNKRHVGRRYLSFLGSTDRKEKFEIALLLQFNTGSSMERNE